MLKIRMAEQEEVAAAYAAQHGKNNPPKPEEHCYNIQMALADIRKAYRGGKAAREVTLIRKLGETDDQFANRWNNYQNVPLLRLIVKFQTSLLYTMPPERCIYIEGMEKSEKSKSIADQFEHIYKDNSADTMFVKRVGPYAFRDLRSWVKVWIDDKRENAVRMTPFKREHVVPIVAEDDADTLLGVVELKPNPIGDKFRRILWTLGGHGEIDEQWRSVGPWSEADVEGCFPWIEFGYLEDSLGNQLDDALHDQRHLVNLRSQIAMAIRSQTFSQAWTSGDIKSGPVVRGPDGKERQIMSPEALIMMAEGGSFNFATPNFPMQAILDAERGELKRTLETYRVSGFSIDPSSAPEQPMSLGIKMLPSLWERGENVACFTESEERLAYVVAKYGAAFEHIDTPVESIGETVAVRVEFPRHVLPMDEALARTADQADVAANLMTIEDYIRKHHRPGADDAEIADLVAMLAGQADARAARTANAFAGAIPPRPAFTPAGATPMPGTNGNGQSPAAQLLARLGNERNGGERS